MQNSIQILSRYNEYLLYTGSHRVSTSLRSSLEETNYKVS
jgi:hypothetical protein